MRTPGGFKSRESPGGRDLSLVDSTAVVEPLHGDHLFSRRECRDQAIVSHAKLAFIGTDQLLEIMIRVGRSALQAIDDPACDGSIHGPEVTNRRVSPLDLPVRQRPNRFLTRSWSVTRRSRMSSRALSNPMRNESVYNPSSSPSGTRAISLLSSSS